MTDTTTYDIIEDSIKSLRASKVRLEKLEKKASCRTDKAEKELAVALQDLQDIVNELETTEKAIKVLGG